MFKTSELGLGYNEICLLKVSSTLAVAEIVTKLPVLL